jgi:HEAT repeat protein
MNKRVLIYGSVLLVFVVFGCVVWIARSIQSSETNGQLEKAPTVASSGGNGSATSTNAAATTAGGHMAPSATNTPPTNNATAKKLLQKMLKQIGIKEMPAVDKHLHDAIASGDKARMLRAFDDAVYHHYWEKGDVTAALKTFLTDPSPYVRYLAGRNFLIMGDYEGYSTLLALVQSNAALDGLSQDVRIDAAETLAQFRKTDATQAIYNLYQQTKNGALISPLEKLGASQAASIVESRGFYAEATSMIHYGLSGATQFVPQITSTFYNTQNLELKASAAWALAMTTNDQNAINYLFQAAQAAINNSNGQTAYGNSWQIIEYLGSIQNPQVKPVLEAALSSSSSGVVQAAAVNLVFNQGGSEKVNQMVAAQLNGPPNLLGADMALNLAPHLISDPEVQTAGNTFSQHDGSGAWYRSTVDRTGWPAYNWIDGYIVKLNKSQK